MKELNLSFTDIQELPDEMFHLLVEKTFNLMSKQVGMGAVGYDFRDEDTRKLEEWHKSESK